MVAVGKFKLVNQSPETLDRQMDQVERRHIHRAEKVIDLERRIEAIGREFFGLVPRPDAVETQNMLDAFHFPERQWLEPRDVAEAEARRVWDNIADDAAKERE